MPTVWAIQFGAESLFAFFSLKNKEKGIFYEKDPNAF